MSAEGESQHAHRCASLSAAPPGERQPPRRRGSCQLPRTTHHAYHTHTTHHTHYTTTEQLRRTVIDPICKSAGMFRALHAAASAAGTQFSWFKRVGQVGSGGKNGSIGLRTHHSLESFACAVHPTWNYQPQAFPPTPSPSPAVLTPMPPTTNDSLPQPISESCGPFPSSQPPMSPYPSPSPFSCGPFPNHQPRGIPISSP